MELYAAYADPDAADFDQLAKEQGQLKRLFNLTMV